jgi:hypothetical protein
MNTIESHNVFALYELDEEGNKAENDFLEFYRPQDWGSPRWHYHYCKIEFTSEKTLYINHMHIWQEMKRNTAAAIAKIPFSVLFKFNLRKPVQLCDRSHLSEEDYWSEEWGEIPPYYHEYIDDNYWSSEPDLPFNLNFSCIETESEPENIKSLGTCCMCEQDDGTVRNILNLPYRNPKAVGWGCFVCNLPMEGATTIVCDSCLEILQNDKAEIKWVCAGYPTEPERIPFDSLTEPFKHKDIPH